MTPLIRLLAGLLLTASAFSTSADDHLHVRVSDDLRTIDATLCFAGEAPNRIYRHERAGDYASPLRHAGEPLRMRTRDDRVYLPPLPENACLDWTLDLGKAADSGDYRTAFRVDDSILAVTSLWFWKGPWKRPLTVSIDLPEGAGFSSPWPRDDKDPRRFRPIQTPSGWYARSAIGTLRRVPLDVPGGVVDVALLGDLDEHRARALMEWIRRTVDAVTPVFGTFPRAYTQVVVVPIGPRSEPVPWAHVVRGGGVGVQFYVDETRSLAEFDADWTATHEFSHLLMPYVSRRDRWLSEGIASYYQNVLRARDGRLSEDQAWQKLYEGFQRGIQATRRETLEAAVNGGRGNTMRVYWSGAAMMLQVDSSLREATDGAWSLDLALHALRDCCWEDGKLWRAPELLAELDRITGTNVFLTVYEENIDRQSFPVLTDTFDALGLETRNGRVLLVDEAPLAGVRTAIMSGTAGETRRVQALDSAP